MPHRNPIFCAIDRPDLNGSLFLARAVGDKVGGLKVGLEFVTAHGPEGVRAIKAYIAGKPKDKFGEHHYDTGGEALIAAERQKFRRFQDYFGIRDEL